MRARNPARKHRIVHRSTSLDDAIAAGLHEAKDRRVTWMIGQVTATSPLNVNAFGTDYGALPRCSTYTPASGDVVLVLVAGQQAVIVDKLVS